MCKNSKVVFKDYSPNQLMFLPPSLEELIDADHPVRVVNQVLEKVNIDSLIRSYKGGGAPSYYPRMMLKVLVYSYLNNTYSSRKMEQSIKENLPLMWLAGGNRPDHNSLNRFRLHLKDSVRVIFTQVVQLLRDADHLDLREVYTDGTIMEANANRYTFVWGKAIHSRKDKMAQQLESLWNYAEQVAREELEDQRPSSFAPTDPEQVRQTIEKIDQALSGKEADEKVRKKLRAARKNWPAQIAKYAEQEELLAGRGSYSKTDQDATFMRMKDDHLKKAQLRPAYNLQISTQNQYILNYTLHSSPADTTTLSLHLETFIGMYKQPPGAIVADAGYGSEENYELCAKKQITAYVKYNTFDRNQKKRDAFKAENFYYNQEGDYAVCPMGQHMHRRGQFQTETANGYMQTHVRYEAIRCEGCPLRGSCHPGEGNREISINHNLRKHKQQADKLLTSEEGIAHRKRRSVDVEPVFAQIKHNKHFKRFLLRAIHKVEIETGLLAIAHNLKKYAA